MDEQRTPATAAPNGSTPHRLQRFFVPGPLAAGATVSLDQLAPQLAQVLRMQAGDELVLLDGGGLEFRARLVTLSRHGACAEVLEARACPAEPATHLTLYQCSLKADKFEWVLQKGTELGVSRFAPVIAERSIVRPAAALRGKYARWETIVREAAEQCGRGRVPEIAPPLEWGEAVRSRSGVGLLAWEGAESALTLAHWLRGQELPPAQLSLLIGPEGGISQREAETATAQGWQLVGLGPRILRAETAAVAAAAIVIGLLL